MPPAAKAQPVAKGRAKAKAKGKAKAKAVPLPPEKTRKQARRRSAVQALNALAADLELGVESLRVKETRASAVTRRVRLLEPKCQEAAFAARLRAATEMWVNNGGKR